MRSEDALNRLRELLREAGVSLTNPTADDVQRTWEVMRRFAEEPVEDAAPREEDGDGILAQYGIYRTMGPDFQLDMTRQFSFEDEDGEYSHMSQLECTFEFAAVEALRAIGNADLWSFGLALDAFFEQALAMPGFRVVRELGLDPLRLVIDYSEI